MKKLLICLVVIAFGTSALAAFDETEVIDQAQTDAREDGKSYCGSGWGVLSFMASFLGSPVAAGGVVLVALVAGEAEVPGARIAAIQDLYADPEAVAVYEARYRQTLTRIQRSKNAGSALAGTALACGLAGLIIAALFAGW